LLLEQCKQHADIDLRWGNKLIDARHREDDGGDGVTVTVQCDQRDYRIDADYLIACDGAKSTVRRRLGLRFEGEVFNDRFLIADIEMGARGGNGGVQDSDNLGWKLAEVIHGRAGDALLDSYHAERAAAADEDILNAARTTDFMTPKTQKSKRIRDRVLRLARAHDFARCMVNAGRMSRAFSYRNFAPFADHPDGARVHAGDAGLDMPLVNAHSGAPSYLLRHIRDYSVAAYQRPRFERRGRGAACHVIHIGDGATDDWRDAQGLMREHYVGEGDNGDNSGGYILFRPDQHILGVWRDREPNAMLDALARQRAP